MEFCLNVLHFIKVLTSIITFHLIIYFRKESFKLFWTEREVNFVNWINNTFFFFQDSSFSEDLLPQTPPNCSSGAIYWHFYFHSRLPRLYHLFPVFMVRCRQIATHTHFWFVSRTWNMKFSQNWGNLLDLVPNWPPLFHTSDPSLEMKHEVFSTLCKLQDLVPNWPHLFQIGFQYHWR